MKVVYLLVVTLVLTLSVGAQTLDPNTVLVTVNGEEIRQQDLDFTMHYFVLPQYAAQNDGQAMPADQQIQITQTLLNQAITELLILQKGRAASVTQDEKVVNTQFEAVKAERPDIPETELKAFLHQKLLVQTIIQQLVASKITVTDEEVRAFYDQQKDQFNEPEKVRASHILVSVETDAPEADKAAARQKIGDILAQLQAGADFAELAKQYSNCPSNQKGGDLGFFPRGVMVTAFEDVTFTLAEGAVSEIVETPFGYHLITVTDKTAARTVSFDEVKDTLRQDVLAQKSTTEVQKWISELRTGADIQFMQVQK